MKILGYVFIFLHKNAMGVHLKRIKNGWCGYSLEAPCLRFYGELEQINPELLGKEGYCDNYGTFFSFLHKTYIVCIH